MNSLVYYHVPQFHWIHEILLNYCFSHVLLDIFLYRRGSRESSAGVRFVTLRWRSWAKIANQIADYVVRNDPDTYVFGNRSV